MPLNQSLWLCRSYASPFMPLNQSLWLRRSYASLNLTLSKSRSRFSSKQVTEAHTQQKNCTLHHHHHHHHYHHQFYQHTFLELPLIPISFHPTFLIIGILLLSFFSLVLLPCCPLGVANLSCDIQYLYLWLPVFTNRNRYGLGWLTR